MAADESRCPRCAREFHCGLHDAQPCACTTVTLGTEQLASLQRLYAGCLCIDCLRALAAGGTAAMPAPAAHAPTR